MVGPNCMGLVNTNPAVRLNATFAPVYPPEGRVGLSSQSGALGLALLDYAARLNLGISTFVSVGNKADVSSNDLVQYWAEDPRTDVILLYLESFGSPGVFARIARRVARRKPIIAVKAGRSQRRRPRRVVPHGRARRERRRRRRALSPGGRHPHGDPGGALRRGGAARAPARPEGQARRDRDQRRRPRHSRRRRVRGAGARAPGARERDGGGAAGLPPRGRERRESRGHARGGPARALCSHPPGRARRPERRQRPRHLHPADRDRRARRSRAPSSRAPGRRARSPCSPSS